MFEKVKANLEQAGQRETWQSPFIAVMLMILNSLTGLKQKGLSFWENRAEWLNRVQEMSIRETFYKSGSLLMKWGGEIRTRMFRRRFTAAFLAWCMVFSLCPMTAKAEVRGKTYTESTTLKYDWYYNCKIVGSKDRNNPVVITINNSNAKDSWLQNTIAISGSNDSQGGLNIESGYVKITGGTEGGSMRRVRNGAWYYNCAMITVDDGATLELENITIYGTDQKGEMVEASEAAIMNFGTLIINGCTFRDIRCETPAEGDYLRDRGGAIYNQRKLTISNSTIYNCQGWLYGAIYDTSLISGAGVGRRGMISNDCVIYGNSSKKTDSPHQVHFAPIVSSSQLGSYVNGGLIVGPNDGEFIESSTSKSGTIAGTIGDTVEVKSKGLSAPANIGDNLVAAPGEVTSTAGGKTYFGIYSSEDKVWNFTNKLNVSFNTNGAAESPDTKAVYYEEKYGELPTVTKQGYTLDGWYRESNFVNKVTADTQVTMIGDQILYAKWNPAQITLSPNSGNIEGKFGEEKKELTDPFYDLTSVTINNDATAGTASYKLTAGQLPSGLTLQQGKITGILSPYNSEPYNATITITGKNGTAADFPLTIVIRKRDSLSNPTGLTAESPTIKGKSDGKISKVDAKMEWKKSSAPDSSYTKCTGTEINDLAPGDYHVRYAEATTSLASDAVTVTVPESTTTLTVTYDSQEGSEVESAGELIFEDTLEAPVEPTRSGYDFTGWYKEVACQNLWTFGIDGDKVTDNITLYAGWEPQQQTTKPSFDSTSCTMADRSATTAEFNLSGTAAKTYKIYDALTGGNEITSNPAVAVMGNTLKLTFDAAPNTEQTFYVSACDDDKTESARTAITVVPFVNPSVALGSDTVVTVKFAYGDSADTVRSDSIDITTTAGTATSTFTASDFSISSSDTANTAIGGVNVTDIGQSEPGSTTLTVAVAKSVTADSGYLWYGENLVGKITLAKTVEEASTDATLSALSYKVGDGNDISVPDFVSATETYDVELPQDTDKNAVISLAGTVNDEKAFIHTNNGVTLENGEGTAEIIVSAESGATKTYSIVFTTAQAPTPEQSAAPVFSQASYTKQSADENTAEFTLTTAAESATTFKVYTNEAGDEIPSGITASANETALTLEGISAVTASTDYYITATEQDKTESVRVKVTVKPYTQTPPTSYSITYTLQNLTAENQPSSVESGKSLTAVLKAADGYKLPDSITVTMGDITLTNESDYTYDSTNGTVTVQNVTGVIEIQATGVQKSAAKRITGFTIPNQTGQTQIDQSTHTIEVTMPEGTSLTSLTPTITVSTDATVSPESGKSQDFTSNVIYTVTAENGSTQAYTVTVTTAQAPTPEQSAAPVFSQASYTKQSADENTAEFTLTTAAESATTFKVYTNEAGDEIPSGITASANETALTLEGISAVTASTDYYITATELDKTESARVKVTVKPYTPTPPTSHSITYTLQNLTAENQPSSVESGKSLTAVLKAADGYKLPDSITVTMGDITLTNESDYTYDRTSGTVNVSNVTGNVTITAEGEKDTTFVAVTEITGVPNMATVGKTLQLTGTVQPSDATNREIIWDITDEGETGATLDEDNKLTATASGTVTITATITGGLEDGDYIQEFMITVAGTASSSDAEYVEKAVKAVEDGTYAVEQSTSENEDSFLTELANLINKILEKLFGAGNTERITTGDIDSMITVNAVAGDEENPDGTDGEFEFSVEIHKGEESTKVEGLTGTIRAAKFTDEEQRQKDQEAVNAAIEKIEGGAYNIPQSKARTEAALKSELKKRAKSKAGNNVTVNDIQITEVELAVAGTKDNPEGTQGSFTFEACVSKGSVRDIWTVELDGTIAPEKYVLKKPSITTGSLPDGTAGEAYEVELKAESDTAVTWAVSDGNLPEGISLDTDGTISGTPETAGTYTVTVSAENGSEQGSAEKTYTITINEPSGKTEHTITASAGTGGTISPSGAVMVADGGNQTFTITAASGYYVSDVLADGTSVGRQTSYEFKNVTGDHTIEAVFTRGSIGPNGGGSGGSGGGGGSSSSTGSSQTTAPSTTTNTAATENGGSVTTTQTTSKDVSGKTTTATTQVTKDPSGNVTGTTMTVTTDNVTTSTDQGNAIINVQPNAAAINSAAGAAGATAENPMDVMVSIPKETVLNEVQKAEVSSVQVNVVLPKAVSDNTAVQTTGVTIEKEAVDAAKAAGKNLEITVRKEDGSLEAVWSLNGQSMQNAAGETTDLNLGVHTAPVQSADPTAAAMKPTVAAKGHENGLVLTITADGTLLSPAKVTVPAIDQTGITAGTAVTLYRYDQTTGALNAVPGGVYTVDANGNVTIDLPAGTRAGAKESYVLLPTQGAQGTHAGGSATHTIKGGDTLNTISQQYGCTVADIMALNPGLDIYDLRVGSGLIIPGKQ